MNLVMMKRMQVISGRTGNIKETLFSAETPNRDQTPARQAGSKIFKNSSHLSLTLIFFRHLKKNIGCAHEKKEQRTL